MRTVIALALFVLCAIAQQQIRTIYAPPSTSVSPNMKLREVDQMLLNAPQEVDNKHGLANLLHTAMHKNEPPKYLDEGYMVNELHPPVKIIVERYTKSRRIPNGDAEVTRKIPAGSVLVALATTPDMLWLQVGQNEFIKTQDAKLEEPINREKPDVRMLSTPLDIHVKTDVTIRKIPDMGGKPVARLHAGVTLSAIGVTPDYAWLMVGPNQFIPTISAKVGDPTTPLNPPVTMYLRRNVVVRDAPSFNGKAVSTLKRGDILQAIAVSSDLMWLKIAHNNYVPTVDCKLGLPLPPVTLFPQPVVIRLVKDAKVVKNPVYPDRIIRYLKKNDELEAFGTTADLKWLVVAEKRFIPMETARMKEEYPEPIKMEPAVPIKLSKATEVRNVPDQNGKVLQIARKGDKYEATAVSPDFLWLQIGNKMWVPMMSAFFRKPEPETNPLVPPIRVTVTKDTKVYKVPEHYAKVVRTLGEGDTVIAVAATPDLAWLKIGPKEYITADNAKIEETAVTTPLFPALKVVVTKDAKVLKSPNKDALPVHRLKRGEVLLIHETTPDMKWLKINENEFIMTEYVAHVAHTTPLTPAVRVVVSADLKARNVPAFAGMTVKQFKKGEIVDAIEVSPDFKWLKLAKDTYIPASGCVLHDTEGKDMLVVLKIRSAHIEKDPVVAKKEEVKPDQSVTTSQAISMIDSALEKRAGIAESAAPQPVPTVDLDKKVKQLRIKVDTLVMEEPRPDANVVRGIKAGSLVDASGLGTNLVWLKIGPGQYVKLSATEPTEATQKN